MNDATMNQPLFETNKLYLISPATMPGYYSVSILVFPCRESFDQRILSENGART